MTGSSSRHISTSIERPAEQVYAFAADPANLPAWAAGLASGIELIDGRWVAESPMGSVTVTFAPPNDYGVLDHDVTLPSGETVHNPMRVLADGPGCEVTFVLRRQPGVTDPAFERDAGLVAADLARLKEVLERGAA